MSCAGHMAEIVTMNQWPPGPSHPLFSGCYMAALPQGPEYFFLFFTQENSKETVTIFTYKFVRTRIQECAKIFGTSSRRKRRNSEQRIWATFFELVALLQQVILLRLLLSYIYLFISEFLEFLFTEVKAKKFYYCTQVHCYFLYLLA